MAAPRRIPPSLVLCPALALLLPGQTLAQETPAPSPHSARLHITAPRPLNGRGEWFPSNRDDGFVSTTPVVCEAAFGDSVPAARPEEQVSSDPDVPLPEEQAASDSQAMPQPAASASLPALGSRLHWRVAVFRGGRCVGTLTGSGSPFTFRPADATHRRCSGLLAVQITATLDDTASNAAKDSFTDSSNPESRIQNPKSEDRIWLQQDEIDQIRQEYLDLPGRKLNLVPRRAFLDRASYERSEPAAIPWLELNQTRRRDGSAYDYILCSNALRDGLRQWQELLGARGLTINSGFRNPLKQSLTNHSGGREGAPGSMHQYGKAVDVRASLRKDFRDWVQVAWAALDARADYVETAAEGGWSHVHADWRHDGQGPALTVKLEIAGRVVDAEGNPVPAARVLGTSDATGGTAGMPAWEGPDADGRFVLRTVWRPGRPYRLRASTSESSATTLLSVPADASGLVHLETELMLAPDTFRVALARRSYRLASRGGRTYWRHRRRRLMR